MLNSDRETLGEDEKEPTNEAAPSSRISASPGSVGVINISSQEHKSGGESSKLDQLLELLSETKMEVKQSRREQAVLMRRVADL